MAVEHAHTWTFRSAHPTSEGTVVYEGCACGAQRVGTPAPSAHRYAEVRPRG